LPDCATIWLFFKLKILASRTSGGAFRVHSVKDYSSRLLTRGDINFATFRALLAPFRRKNIMATDRRGAGQTCSAPTEKNRQNRQHFISRERTFVKAQRSLVGMPMILQWKEFTGANPEIFQKGLSPEILGRKSPSGASVRRVGTEDKTRCLIIALILTFSCGNFFVNTYRYTENALGGVEPLNIPSGYVSEHCFRDRKDIHHRPALN